MIAVDSTGNAAKVESFKLSRVAVANGTLDRQVVAQGLWGHQTFTMHTQKHACIDQHHKSKPPLLVSLMCSFNLIVVSHPQVQQILIRRG